MVAEVDISYLIIVVWPVWRTVKYVIQLVAAFNAIMSTFIRALNALSVPTIVKLASLRLYATCAFQIISITILLVSPVKVFVKLVILI